MAPHEFGRDTGLGAWMCTSSCRGGSLRWAGSRLGCSAHGETSAAHDGDQSHLTDALRAVTNAAERLAAALGSELPIGSLPSRPARPIGHIEHAGGNRRRLLAGSGPVPPAGGELEDGEE